ITRNKIILAFGGQLLDWLLRSVCVITIINYLQFFIILILIFGHGFLFLILLILFTHGIFGFIQCFFCYFLRFLLNLSFHGILRGFLSCVTQLIQPLCVDLFSD